MRFSGMTVVLLAACLATSSCKDNAKASAGGSKLADAGAKPLTPPPPGSSWTTFAGDHGAFVEQRGIDATRCRVTCTLKDDAVAWTLDRCIGTEDDLRFVSLDCGSVFVFVPYPEVEGDWAQTTVLRVWGRDGLIREMKAAQYVRNGTELKRMKTRFRWLKGVLGELGNAPRYTEDGRGVEVETLDDQLRIAPLLPMPSAPPPQAAPAPDAPAPETP